jgi:hypothetical protein
LTKPIEKPARTLDIKINGEDTEIKMSFALLQEVMKVIDNPENVTALLISDFYLRDWVVRRVLTGNKRVKSDDDLIDLFDVEVDDEKLDDLVLWVTDHVLYFFTATAQKTMKLGEKYQAQVAAITPSAQSQTGSPT